MDFGIRNWIVGLSGVLLVGVVYAAPISFDFEEFSGGAENALVSKGFVLDPGARDWVLGAPDYPDGPWIGHYHIAPPTGFGPANNGTKFFVFDYFRDNSTLNIYSTSDKVFGVKRLDLAEAGELLQDGECPPVGGYEMLFTGYLEGGGTISLHAPLDMVCDGNGPKIDFETFEFDSHWSRLTMLTIAQLTDSDTPWSYVGLDNLVLSTVSEPNSLALLSLVLAGVTFTRRRKQ